MSVSYTHLDVYKRQVPVGDTFRQEGPLREYEIAGCEYFVSQLVSLGFSMENSMLQIFANGKKILQDIPITLPFAVSRMPAVFVKAVNEGGKNRESQVILGTYDLRGKKAPNPEKISVDVEFCGPSKEKKTYSKWERENIPQELLKRNLDVYKRQLIAVSRELRHTAPPSW